MGDQHPHLYHLTARRPDSINAAAVCSFSSGIESLVVARGTFLELFELNDDSELELKARTNCFAPIRCLRAVCMPGSAVDKVVLTSASGYLSVLEFDRATARFSRLSAEQIAPEKLRHEFPGEYLAVDPRGRVAFVASISNLRSAVLFDGTGIKPPAIEVPAPSTFCYSAIALDYGYENPRFACLERFRFGDKQLAVYEFNLGLNHLMKEWSQEVPDDCDLVVELVGGNRDVNAAKLIAFAGTKAWTHDNTGKQVSQAELESRVVCACAVNAGRNNSFTLVCLESGKFVKLVENGTNLSTAPVQIDDDASPNFLPDFLPCSMSVLKSGHIFVACSSGNHKMYQIVEMEPLQLSVASELNNIAPALSSTLANRRLVISSGQTRDSSRPVHIEFGINTEELASTPLPSTPTAVFTAKSRPSIDFDDLIIIAFDGTTATLAIGDDGAVEEISEAETGVASNLATLGAASLQWGFVQVHSKGLRYISRTGDSAPKISPWLAPANTKVLGAAFSPSQVAVALSNGSVIYFEESNGSLMQSQHRLQPASKVCALAFTSSNASELKSMRLLVVLEDSTLRQYGLPQLKQQKIFNLKYLPTAVAHSTNDRDVETIFVGHVNGTVSEIREEETLLRLVGGSPVRLGVLSNEAVIAVSSQSWVLKNNAAVPLLGIAPQGLVSCHKFLPEGAPHPFVIGVKDSSLEVFSLEADRENTGSQSHFYEALGAPIASLSVVHDSQSDRAYVFSKTGSLHVYDNSALTQLSQVESRCEAPRAITNVRFESKKREFLAVASGSKISIFEYERDGSNEQGLNFLHETSVGGECYALLAFRGKLLAGVENQLRLYDLGKRQLLLQDGISVQDFISVRALRASRNLVYAGDTRRSVAVINYSSRGLELVGMDPVPRAVTRMVLLDLTTVCVGDQYGNLSVLRYPGNTGDSLGLEKVHQLELVAHFWVPDAIVGLHRGSLFSTAGMEAIVYVGIQGTVGVLIPFISMGEHEFFADLESHLESTLRTSIIDQPIAKSSGYYTPRKNVINGDACELLIAEGDESLLLAAAEATEKSIGDLFNRLETIKNRGVRRGPLLINRTTAL